MIYHIYANQTNIGDWLSAKGIQKLLNMTDITECFCDEPFVNQTMQLLSQADENDLIIIGGGGLLMDYFVPFWKAFQHISEKVPYVIWGIGYCSVKHQQTEPPVHLIEQIVNKSKLCVLRDQLSINYLTGCNVYAPVACPALNIVLPEPTVGGDILHVVNYDTATAQTYEAMCLTVKAFAVEQNMIYRQTNNLVSKGNEKELYQILDLYRKSGIVVSSALHGCIIGVAMGLKVIAVSGDWKIDEFMKSVGLQDWILNYDEAHLLPHLLNRVTNQTHPSDKLNDIRKENKNIALLIREVHSMVL